MDTLNERLIAHIAELETQIQQHQTEAKRLTGLKDKLTLLVDGEEDPQLEHLLYLALNPPPAQVVELPPPPPPPPTPIKRIQVKCDDIFAITQTFDGLFTLDNVVDVLTAQVEHHVDLAERQRVRSAVSSMLKKLVDNGRALHVEKGLGKRQGKFRRVRVSATRPAPPYKNGAPEDIDVGVRA